MGLDHFSCIIAYFLFSFYYNNYDTKYKCFMTDIDFFEQCIYNTLLILGYV